jgi:hypothetical protein
LRARVDQDPTHGGGEEIPIWMSQSTHLSHFLTESYFKKDLGKIRGGLWTISPGDQF